ncbi:hypothetical protein WN982_34040 [Paraburkholderia sp. IMGN_8]|uniref:hypothetical protein n=1 Tax=Paraburkholderia sp. IMGN_8 TaxID=3136564 RepID=UPI0031015BBD
MTSISDGMVASMKAILADVAGVPAGHAIVCASHTFSAPHVFPAGHVPAGTDMTKNDAILAAFEVAIRSASTHAVSTLQPARLGVGSGTSRVSVNRDVATANGWWLGANDAGFSDPFVGVLRIDGMNGKPLAILMNIAVQSSIMDGSRTAAGGRMITADLAGAAARYVEAHYGSGAVALFLVGAAGDQAPYLQANRHTINPDGSVGRVDLHEASFALVDLLGERLGSDVVRVADTVTPRHAHVLDVLRENVEVTSQAFSPRNAPVGPVAAFNYERGAKTAVPVVLLRIGSMTLVGVQPELAASIGARIRTYSPYPDTLVATMVDGAAKYMPDAQSYDRFTYEARSSPFARGAAETAADAIVDKLKQLKNAGS